VVGSAELVSTPLPRSQLYVVPSFGVVLFVNFTTNGEQPDVTLGVKSGVAPCATILPAQINSTRIDRIICFVLNKSVFCFSESGLFSRGRSYGAHQTSKMDLFLLQV